MAFEQRDLDSYIDVAQRIADFRERYPEGTLQPAEPWRVVQVQCEWCRQCIGRRSVKSGQTYKQCPRCDGTGLRGPGEPVLDTFIVYVAAAYRSPDDPRPGIGVAWEPFPGQTPYTLNSELMNAETSAQGRAIVAVGASDSKRGIASREEVRNRQAERDDGLPVNRDGSLSRSRTSDEEKAAAGVMTSEQHAEHTQLAKPPPTSGKVERFRPTSAATAETGSIPGPGSSAAAPPDDPWLDGPAGLNPEVDPEDRPGTASASQIGQLKAAYAQLGIKDRDKQLEITRGTLKIEVLPTHTRLSYRQAGDLLLALRAQAKAEARG